MTPEPACDPGAAMCIRPARADELGALSSIAWSAKAHWGYTGSQLDAWRDALTPSEPGVRSRPTCVAERDGELAGFYQLDLSSQPVELAHLWVHPRFMREGVGRALLAHAVASLASRGIASLHIDSDPHAAPFYLACGATVVGVEAAPIEGQPDRVRPQLRLSTTQVLHP
jgi:GNAT superfamily N-acetyltransferase